MDRIITNTTTMTVKELKEKLHQFPDHIDVMVRVEDGDYVYNPVSDVQLEDVDMREDIDGEVLAKQSCAVIYIEI